jgi:hypothetical protein
MTVSVYYRPIETVSQMLRKLQTESKSYILWDITLCNTFKVNQCFRGTCRPHLHSQRICQVRNEHESRLSPPFTLVSSLAYTSTMKTEGVCPSEISVDIQWTTQRYFLGDRTLHIHHCENL